MPSYDKILQISEPTGRESFTFDYGHGVTSWYGASFEAQETLASEVRRVDPPRRARSVERGRASAYDRFQLDTNGDNPYLAWGASALPDTATLPSNTEGRWFNGCVAGAPADMDISRLESLFPDDARRLVVGTFQWSAYASSTDPRDVAPASLPLPLESVRRLAEGVYDFRLQFLRVPRDSWGDSAICHGLRCEAVISLAETVHSHWGRLLESGGLATTLQISQTDVDAVTETRSYELRWSPHVGVFSSVMADGAVWTVTGVDEVGRKRALRIECERSIRRASA